MRRLPGIAIEAEPRAPRLVLPRMDIAAFVGFASGGPFNVPVPVESFGRFRELFGEDVHLAHDPLENAPAWSCLGPTVESFFANGGRRCWVVRVGERDNAGRRIAHLDRYRVAELARSSASLTLESVELVARSPGTWSSGLRVGSELSRRSLRLADLPETSITLSPANASVRLSALPTEIELGELLELEFASQGLRLLCDLSTAEEFDEYVLVKSSFVRWFRPAGASPPSDESVPVDPSDALAQLGTDFGRVRAAYLRFGLVAMSGGVRSAVLPDLAFLPAHPRCFAHLPDDAELFAPTSGRLAASWPDATTALFESANEPRFPFSRPESVEGTDVFLPVDMPEVAGWGEGGMSTVERIGRAAEQDGAGRFDPSAFLDPELELVGRLSLMSEAEHKRSIEGRDLEGMHALLPIEEVTILAIPDAVHRDWFEPDPVGYDSLRAPELAPVVLVPDGAQLEWSVVEGASCYAVEVGRYVDFADRIEQQWSDEARALAIAPRECSESYYYRVRALDGSRQGPWSNTRVATEAGGGLSPCDTTPEVELEIRLDRGSPASRVVGWIPEVLPAWPDDVHFQIQVTTEIEFGALLSADFTDEFDYDLPDSGSILFVRVRAESEAGAIGPWSITLAIDANLAGEPELMDPVDDALADDLLGVQRALLRFCAARGDLLGVLSVPAHFGASDIANHVAALRPPMGSLSTTDSAAAAGTLRVPRLTRGEVDVLGYGALYAPWLVRLTSTDTSSNASSNAVLRRFPPEGAVAGLMARLALGEGAWMAPANRPLEGLLAVQPDLGDAWAALTLDQANVVLSGPRGFMPMSSDTLSLDEDLRAISVRRLLALIRRLSLREGRSYLFECNDADLRSRVRRRFEAFLSYMYQRNAFRGGSPSEAYRVVTDGTVNSRSSIDAGRLVIELQFAPARPMEFLRVRLAISSPENLAIEEVA